MICPICNCPGAEILLVNVICVNHKCKHYDPQRMRWDPNRLTINGDSKSKVLDWLRENETRPDD